MYCDNFLLNFNLKKNLNLKKTNSKIILSVVDKKKAKKEKFFLKKIIWNIKMIILLIMLKRDIC